MISQNIKLYWIFVPPGPMIDCGALSASNEWDRPIGINGYHPVITVSTNYKAPPTHKLVSWGQPGVLKLHTNVDIIGGAHCDRSFVDNNISAELPMLVVFGDPCLPCTESGRCGRCKEPQTNEGYTKYLNPIVFIVGGTAFGFVGLWFCLFRARTKGAATFLIGFGLFAGGWIGVVYGGYHVGQILLSENASSSRGYVCVSAPCYGGTENVLVVPVVITPRELGNIQRQVLAADLMEATHDAALQKRPETVDRLSVDRAVDRCRRGSGWNLKVA